MNYNQTNFYHRSPFYKQDYLPDRAWFNREARQFPSQLPSGKDFLPSSGRKHYDKKFNHSEIEQQSVLKSPERFPFENKIAMDKTYMRSLNTIDIEGASSNTRVNQSIKNKYRARDQLTRKYNQSIDLPGQTEEQKRRKAAIEYYRHQRLSGSSKKIVVEDANQNRTQAMPNPEQKPSPSLKRDLGEQYKKFVMHNSSNKFHKDVPIVKQSPRLPYNQAVQERYHSIDPVQSSKQYIHPERPNNEVPRQYPEYPYPYPSQAKNNSLGFRYQDQPSAENMKRIQEYQKIQSYDNMTKQKMKSPTDFRKNNPTNLSLSFAGQSIVTKC